MKFESHIKYSSTCRLHDIVHIVRGGTVYIKMNISYQEFSIMLLIGWRQAASQSEAMLENPLLTDMGFSMGLS